MELMAGKGKIITGWDTESTGLNPILDRVIEVAFITKKDGKVLSQYQQYINPEMKVSQGAFEVHKISDAMLKDKPTFREVYTDILDYLIESNFDELGAYNGDFDTILLSMEFERLKKEHPHLPTMHEYIKQNYPDFIPFKERTYHYDFETDSYSFTGTPIKNVKHEITALIDMFPTVDIMPPLIQATLSISNSQSGRESLDAIASRLEIAWEKLDIDLEQRKSAHGALIDTHITLACYEEALKLGLLSKTILELEFKFSGKELKPFNPNIENHLKINPDVAQQAVSFNNRKNKIGVERINEISKNNKNTFRP